MPPSHDREGFAVCTDSKVFAIMKIPISPLPNQDAGSFIWRRPTCPRTGSATASPRFDAWQRYNRAQVVPMVCRSVRDTRCRLRSQPLASPAAPAASSHHRTRRPVQLPHSRRAPPHPPHRTRRNLGLPKMSDPGVIFEQTSKTAGHPSEFRFE